MSKAPRITVESVARDAGLSKATVSAVLSGKRYRTGERRGIGVSTGTHDRVIESARRLRYRPAQPKALLRIYPEEGHFCLLLTRHLRFDPLYAELFVSITDELQADPLNLNIAQFDPAADYLDNPTLAPHAVSSPLTTRYLLLGPENETLIRLLLENDKRVAYLGRVVETPGVFCVSPDFFEAARLGVGKLLQLGHRRIHVLGDHYFAKTHRYHAGRFVAGAERAMSEHGLSLDHNRVVYFDESEAEAAYPQAVVRLLKRSPRPTAIFCMCDWTALRTLRAVYAEGLQSPRDVSIVGCNDDRRSIDSTPSITSIHVGIKEIAAAAVRYLREVVPGREIDASQLLIRPRLVERESTGPCPDPA